jgi:hypothetical protein
MTTKYEVIIENEPGNIRPTSIELYMEHFYCNNDISSSKDETRYIQVINDDVTTTIESKYKSNGIIIYMIQLQYDNYVYKYDFDYKKLKQNNIVITIKNGEFRPMVRLNNKRALSVSEDYKCLSILWLNDCLCNCCFSFLSPYNRKQINEKNYYEIEN